MISARSTKITHDKLRGGRVTKWKGVAASMAPVIGIVLPAFAIGAALSYANPAKAASECGAEGSGPDTITCTSANYGGGDTFPNYPGGISYTGSDGLTLNLNNSAMTIGNPGVSIRSSGTNTNNITVNGTSFATIATVGNNAYGLFALIQNPASGGVATVTMDGGSITTGGTFSHGLLAQTTGMGDAFAILNDGTISTTGSNSRGVMAYVVAAGTGDAHAEINGGSIAATNFQAQGVLAQALGTSSSAYATITGGAITTSGTAGYGVRAVLNNAGSLASENTVVTASGGSINTTGAGAHAFASVNNGLGGASADIEDAVATTSGQGAHALLVQTGNGLSATARVAGDSQLTASGINAVGLMTVVNQPGAIYSVSVADMATVTGGSGADAAGIRTNSVLGSSGSIDVAADALVDGSTLGTYAVYDLAGDTDVIVEGTIMGAVILGDGSDTLTFASTANMADVTQLNGGDDTGTADSFIDTLTLQGQTVTFAGADLLNWESIVLDGAELAISDGVIEVGGDDGYGLFAQNGARLDAGGGLAITGNLTLTDATFQGFGGGAGAYSVSGNLVNDGIVTTQDGVVGDVLTVGSNYSGSGELHIDVDTATDTADMIEIGGDASGATSLVVNNLSPTDATGSDFLVVSVTGTSDVSNFTLSGGPLAAGAFRYDLGYDAGDFFLRAALSGTGAVYEAAPHILLDGFGRMPTLEQRVGQRKWNSAAGSLEPTLGGWVRLYGDWSDVALSTGTSYDSDAWGLQGGFDIPLERGEYGQWVIGLTAQAGDTSASVSTAAGAGTLSAESLGVGATATWYGHNQTYVDLQAQVNWASVNYSSDLAGRLAEDELARTASASIEVGRRFSVSENAGWVPQAQLVWSQVDGGSFTDSAGNFVDIGKTERVMGRIGLAYDYEWQSEMEDTMQNVYVIANLLHDFTSDASVNVVGATLASERDATWGEIGIGGSVVLNENATLYGEASYRTAFNSSDSSTISATAGLRLQW